MDLIKADPVCPMEPLASARFTSPVPVGSPHRGISIETLFSIFQQVSLTRAFACSLVLMAILSGPAQGAKDKPGRIYQEFLNGPASYLITKAERETFLLLKTDQDRDAFLDRFWEIRNPRPGTGQNEFKEEFFRRVAWVNSFYGRDAGTDGWRTDRGKTYILFGRPQTTMSWPGNQELFPTELWFYSNPGLTELPPFFYVLFFDRDGIGGYRFYHPFVDGPDKLMRSGATKDAAFRYLKNISAELAYASLSLIPGEPIDTDTFSGSMASAAIVNGIQGYREMPSYVSTIRQRAMRAERVTSRVEYDLPQVNMLTFLAWEKGETWLHWQVQVRDSKQPKVKAGHVRYDVTARLYSGDKLVVERTDSPQFSVPQSAGESLRARPFIYEDRMPVVEGKFRLAVTIVNTAAGKTYETEREILAPPGAGRALMSDILIVSRFEPDKRLRPFEFAGVKFFPSPTPATTSSAGLRLFYQITIPEPRPAEVPVEYVVGNIANKVRKTFEDKLDLRAVDAFGSLMTSKTLPLDELAPGAYQVAVRVKDPRTGRITAGSAAFTILAEADTLKPIVVSQGRAETPQWAAAAQYERALCWLSQGRQREAVMALEDSYRLSRNPAVEELLDKLRPSSRNNREDRVANENHALKAGDKR